MKDKVSIIVPYHNSRKWIERLIDSMKAQSHTDFECIMVDDGGTDGTFELVEEVTRNDERFRNLKRPSHVSPGGRGAKNHGFSMSNAGFIVFFDSDDVMYPDYLSGRIGYLQENPGKDGVVSDFGWRVRPGEKKRVYRYNRRLFEDFRSNVRQDWFWLNYMDYRFWFNPGNPMWRRSSIADKPLWDVTTAIGEDHEYHARLMLSGLDIGILEGVHWDYMANDESMIATSESITPLLSRSHGKMLVLENLMAHLGLRKELVRKEFTCQVKLLRRIMACDAYPEEKRKAVDVMMSRIERTMELMGYPIPKRALVRYGLRTVTEWHAKTGRAHRLYSLMARDHRPTDENAFFRISETNASSWPSPKPTSRT
jgi:glycosyltransferase involved in cell wall biosynthesis